MPNTQGMLTGIKEISDYVRRSWPTIHKWIENDNFPATKIDGVWESETHLIAKWRKRRILKKEGVKNT